MLPPCNVWANWPPMPNPELRIQGFAPLMRADAKLLILGSMPGAASLHAHAYYAHPRNAFWPIVGEWCGMATDLHYAQRVSALLDARIALWDVLQHCERAGSLDSAIKLRAAQPNAIAELLSAHPQIRHVLFNGATAATLYRRYQLPDAPALQLLRLPSTSPAHADMSMNEKRRRWHAALDRAIADGSDA